MKQAFVEVFYQKMFWIFFGGKKKAYSLKATGSMEFFVNANSVIISILSCMYYDAEGKIKEKI